MKKINKLFINPEAKSNRNTPNLSLAYLATKFKTAVIDFNTKPDNYQRLFDFEAETLGLSIQTRSYNHAQKVINDYTKKFPRAKIVSLNGPLDIQCCYPFINLENKIDYPDKFGDDLPFPNYELFDSFDIFQEHWQKNYWSYTIMTSLGCPYGCTYCAAHNRAWIPRSPKNCYLELKNAKEKWQIKSFKILDDCFNLKEDRVIEFCNLIKPLNLKWSCVNGLRADKFTDQMANAMRDSGCQQIGFGIESTDEQILKNINKGETFEQISTAVNISRKYFKKIVGFFIIGLPGSSYEKDLNSLNWAKNNKLLPNFSFFVPITDGQNIDNTFCGEKTSVFSDEYSQEKQNEIFDLANKFLKSKNNNFFNKLKNKFNRYG